MKIIKLISENVKKIKAIMIEPSGSAIIIGSEKNGAGKSSVLDSILYALGGTRGICDEPLRHGAKKGKVVCDLGDIIVTRTFNKSGSTALVVRDNNGTQIGTPQQLLDKIVGKIGLDPLAFSRMEPGKQVKVFQELLDLDFSELDAKRAELYQDRTEVNKDLATYKTLTNMPPGESAPTKRISIGSLADKLKQAREENKLIDSWQAERTRITEEANSNVETMDKLTLKLNDMEARQKDIQKATTKLDKHLNEAQPVNESKIMNKMTKVEEINEQVAVVERYVENKRLYRKAKMKSVKLTQAIEKIDKDKETRLDEADVPVKGLTFDEAGLFYNNVPFSQLGSGEQLRISVAMGLAMNPELKVLLIRDGSLLDKDNLRMIAEMAEEKSAQVWIEKVSTGEECTLIIEDGMERESNQAQEKLF